MSDPTNSPTARLGAFVARQARAELRPDLAEKAAICLLDALGLAVLADREPTVVAMRALCAAPAADGVRLWPGEARAGLSDAVTANAIAVHALFQDDNETASWSHPASLVTPVAVCAGESVDAPLASVLRALAIGYATMSWLGAGERVARAMIRRGIRTSPTLGTLGAAATAAAIFQLDGAQATHAVGIASSITGGVLEPVRSGSDEWRVQNAHAARGGLLAAQLAGRGVAGAAQGLEGPKGLMRSLAGLDAVDEWEQSPTLEPLLMVWAKPWATLGDNVPAVMAAAALRQAGIDAAAIREVRVRIWRHYAEYPGTAYAGPFDSVAQALASTAFGVSAMLALGELDYAVSQSRRGDPSIAALVPRVTIGAHDGHWHEASVELLLADGSRLARTSADVPRTLIFHDRPTATALFEQRLARSGWPSAAGSELAGAVFAAADGSATLGVRGLLDRLSDSRRR